jgi:hypothetical protein
LKCGTSIGRIVDEACDVYQYMWLSVVVGYYLRLPPGWLNLSYILINLPMYTMELKFIMTGKLDFCSGPADELGPVEMELIFVSLMVMCAIFGPCNFTLSFLPEGIFVSHIFAAIFFGL